MPKFPAGPVLFGSTLRVRVAVSPAEPDGETLDLLSMLLPINTGCKRIPSCGQFRSSIGNGQVFYACQLRGRRNRVDRQRVCLGVRTGNGKLGDCADGFGRHEDGAGLDWQGGGRSCTGSAGEEDNDDRQESVTSAGGHDLLACLLAWRLTCVVVDRGGVRRAVAWERSLLVMLLVTTPKNRQDSDHFHDYRP